MDTIFVKNVKEGGPAQLAGLNTGDRIVSVNGESVNGKSYSQVISLIQSSDSILKLLVVPRDEDILQMAYQGSLGVSTSVSLEPPESNQRSSSQTSPYRSSAIDENSIPGDTNLPPKRRDTPYKFESTYDYNPRPRNAWKNFYASDSRVYRQPLRNDDSDNKGMSARDRKLERPVSEDTGGKMASILPSKNTYSYGLIIPPKDDCKASSVDNLTHTSTLQYPADNSNRPRRLGVEHRQSSADSDSQQDKKGSSRHSYTEPTSFIISRSKTTSALSNPTNRPLQAPTCSVQWNPSSRRGSDNADSAVNRHFVPVVSESPIGKGSQFSTSVDSIDLRTGRYKQERQWQPSKPAPRESGNSGRTFVVRIPVSDRNDNQNNSRSGTAFALTRSPVTQIEIHKGPSRPIVSHRKQQFEEGKTDNIAPHGVNLNRYRTELDKLSALKKLSSVANRAAQFEGKSDTSGTTSSDESCSPPLGIRSRKSSDQYGPSEQTPHIPQHKAERPTTLSKYSESAPIRIYVSPGSSSAPSSPIVEIVPLFSEESNRRETNQRPTSYPQNAAEDQYDGNYHARIIHENITNSRPVRKTSYLSAVNAPRTRYQEEESPESQVSHGSVASSGENSCMELGSNDPVKIRKKNASLEEETLKLHRRTSYLMATAKERSDLNQPLEKTFLPTQPMEDEPQSPPNRNQSLKKLKNFFGEKEKQPETPSILEATEPHQPPDSPLPQITKEGLLLCKTAVTDGKKSSDRSWRPLWVVLRGHALYLCKDKKEGSHMPNFEEQPISIKSCLIDIAHDYAKKKRNVFRLSTYNGSEYLFQTDDRGTMMSWIQAIKTNNDPDCDENSLQNFELISRKISSHELSQMATKNSPQVSQKGKKLSGLKKLTGSPSVKRKKTGEKDESKTKNWKKMVPKSFFRNQESTSQAAVEIEEDTTKTFGVCLKDCIPSPHNEYVPLIVELCARIVEARGLEVVGVYRVPGNSISVNAMLEDLNKGIENISIDNEKWLDVNVISSLLKAFFRKLPESLITDKCYDKFISTNRIENPETRMLKLKRLIHTLPDHHFETLKYMAEHLNKVASFGYINKMNAKNLAIMFGPTLIRKSDDDKLSMVKDMSDQCRIVESIILKYDWFFSSWDQDDHVPLEDVTEISPPTSSADTSRVIKDDDEELDSQINAREIVSSIITAANRKLKNKETSKSCDELNCSPPAYSDLDIQRQGPPPPYTQSGKLSGMSASEEFIDRKPPRSVPVYERKPPPPPPPYEQEWQMVFQKLDPNSTRNFTRHYSDDSLVDRNDELEISHGLSNSWSLSRDTLDRLKKIKKDTSLIIEREEQRQKDMEQRRLEQQRYEQEYQRTKQEIEMEESDDLFNLREFTSRINTMANRPDNSPSGHGQGFLLARAHPVRCGTTADAKQENPQQNVADRSSQDSGKYFVSIGNSRGRSRDKTPRSAMQGSLDSLAPCVPRAGSLENMLDTHNVHARKSDKTSYRRSRDYDQDYSQDRLSSQNRRRQSTLNRNSAIRHGSLDSLIDLLDRNENRNSWSSTDSEDGLDLLTDLTTTFDQKLQILSNPKYKLNGSSRKSRTDSSSASASTTSDLLDEKDFDLPPTPELPPPINEQTKPQPVILPRYPQNVMMTSASTQDKKFQDPSLHRSHKSETKIGIASRFERNPQIPPSGAVSSSTPSGPISLVQWTCSNPSDLRGKPPLKLTIPASLPYHKQKSLDNQDYRQTQKLDSVQSKYGGKHSNNSASKRQNEDNDSNNKNQSDISKRPKKRGKRRHTVGGADDWENMKALMIATGCNGKEELKTSAWEQLQPVIKDVSPRKRTLDSWIKQERLRGSTPDLSSLGTVELSNKSYYL